MFSNPQLPLPTAHHLLHHKLPYYRTATSLIFSTTAPPAQQIRATVRQHPYNGNLSPMCPRAIERKHLCPTRPPYTDIHPTGSDSLGLDSSMEAGRRRHRQNQHRRKSQLQFRGIFTD